jgi:hypothetical protein
METVRLNWMRKVGVTFVSNVWDCEYYLRCTRNTECLRCGPTQRFLTLPEDKQREKYRGKANRYQVTAATDNSGGTLEEYVRTKLNDVPTLKEYEARRQVGSGNVWFMPGDVTDTVLLTECKERMGVETSKGKKSISITKAMLEKIEAEAKIAGGYPALPFRFKDDESGKTYVINDFDVLCEMVHEIKILRHQHKVDEQEKEAWKKAAEDLQKEVDRLKRKLKKKA